MMYSPLDVLHVAIENLTTTTAIVADPGDGYRIVVLHYSLTLDAAGEVQFESATTNLTGLIELAADTPLVAASPTGVLKCAPSQALNLTATTACNGHLSYVVMRG